ncbi:MAG TPA: hypothetical protein VIK79_12910, partial [Xanthobacteraceae bacterium]
RGSEEAVSAGLEGAEILHPHRARPAHVTALQTRISHIVTRGLDPRVHFLGKTMDCRVKPGNDG